MNEADEAASIRRLTPEDRRGLADFRCRRFNSPWTDNVEEMIRVRLVPEMELTDDLEAWGLWLEDQLAGVAVWRFQAEEGICHSIVVAVDYRYQRRGYGRQLKIFQLGQARQAGAHAVVSVMDWNNDPMIQLNWTLGGTFRHPHGDPDHLECIIAL